jgi:hypothetical protein
MAINAEKMSIKRSMAKQHEKMSSKKHGQTTTKKCPQKHGQTTRKNVVKKARQTTRKNVRKRNKTNSKKKWLVVVKPMWTGSKKTMKLKQLARIDRGTKQMRGQGRQCNTVA